MPTELYYSERKDCPGYLEFIYRKGNPHSIAYITNNYATHSCPEFYTAIYGIHEICGSSVASVKAELFNLIDSGV
jgi:hypothetical protein